MQSAVDTASTKERLAKHFLFALIYTAVGMFIGTRFHYADPVLAVPPPSGNNAIALPSEAVENKYLLSDGKTGLTRRNSNHQQAPSQETVRSEDFVRVPRKLLRYLKADSINIESMTFKEPMLELLGLNAVQRAALNNALKQVSLQAAEFQKQHCVLKQDKEGGQYYEIKPTAEELSAALSRFASITKVALSDSDPGIADTAYNLLEQSPLLSDFQYASQELSIIDAPGGLGPSGKKNSSIEIKRFDQNGNLMGRTVLLATPELMNSRYPFLVPRH